MRLGRPTWSLRLDWTPSVSGGARLHDADVMAPVVSTGVAPSLTEGFRAFAGSVGALRQLRSISSARVGLPTGGGGTDGMAKAGNRAAVESVPEDRPAPKSQDMPGTGLGDLRGLPPRLWDLLGQADLEKLPRFRSKYRLRTRLWLKFKSKGGSAVMLQHSSWGMLTGRLPSMN